MRQTNKTIVSIVADVINFILENDPVKKEELRTKLKDEHLDFFFSRFERQLKENNGHFGKKVI